jgi:uncharacterized protein YqgC (DUF456 family)
MENFLSVLFPWVIGAVMLVGLALTLLPILPGFWIMWIAALVYGLVTGFDTAGIVIMVIITLLTVVGGFMDNLMMGANARISGASWLSIGIALAGAILGSILLPPLGGLAFALLGIFLVEFLRIKDWRQALTSTKSMAVGLGWAILARFGFGLLVLIAWLIWVFAFH